jgi:hypothetical protein
MADGKRKHIEWRSPEAVERDGDRPPVAVANCLRPFRLRVRRGPAEVVAIGDEVSIFDRALLVELFVAGKIDPIRPAIAELAEYRVSRTFTYLDSKEREYRVLENGTMLRLTKAEALPWLRRRLIVPLDEAAFCL